MGLPGSLLDILPVGIGVQGEDGYFIEVNDELAAIMGVSKEDLLRGNHYTLKYVNAQGKPLQREEAPSVRARREGREVRDVVMGIERKDGETIYLNVSAAPIPPENKHVVVVMVDITAQKRAEEALRDRAYQLAEAELVGDSGSFSLDLKTHHLVWSDQNFVLHGLPPGGAPPSFDEYSKRVHPDDHAHLDSMFYGAIGSGSSAWSCEFRYIRPDGEVRSFLSKAAIRYDSEGKPHRMVGVTRDITERKRAEDALRQSEANLAITLQSIGDAVIATDFEGRVTRMNSVAEALTGWSFAEARGRPLVEVFRIVNERTRKEAESPVQKVLRQGIIVGLANHTSLIARGGREIPIADSGAPIRDAGGAITGVVMVFRDVTEERRHEAELRASEARLRAVIDEMPVIVVASDESGRVVFWNRECERVTGYSMEEVAAHADVLDLLYPDPAHKQEAQRFLAANHGDFSNWETTIRRKDRTTRDMLWFSSARRVPIPGWASWIVGLDVTEQKRLTQKLHLSERMAAIGTLAAGVAHEINNPLSFVTANLGFLADRIAAVARGAVEEPVDKGALLALVKRAEEALIDAQQGSERVRQIVRDLKTFARADEERTETVDLRKVIESCIQICSNEVRHRAQLARVWGPIPPVQGNESRLAQVFLNLLINAAQAIPEGAADQNTICIETRTSIDGKAIVEIRDSGPGIPDEVVSRIFDPFFTTKPIGVGTGLGLAIGHSIVTALGGSIEVETELGRGTLFRVILPAAAGSTRAVPSAPTVDDGVRRAKLLVIDDEPMIARLITRILGEEHDVDAVTSSRAAQARIAAGERFDLILCDLMMPEVTGMSFYEWLCGIDVAQATRVVFMTGGAFTPRARHFLETVPNARLEKPFSRAELDALLQRTLAQTLDPAGGGGAGGV